MNPLPSPDPKAADLEETMADEPFDDGLILERGERATIPPLKGLDVSRPMTVHVIGQSHLDIVWYWPLSEAVRMTLETFRGHAELLEADPSRTFCQSQVALFEIVREEEPALFKRIHKLVQEGRWELVGGEWVEPALTIGGPETHARQFLVGQRYLQEHFGTKAKVGWCPDGFVMQPDCYPQLLRQAGIDRFVHKRPREKYMPLPTLPYRWRGNDGSEVVALRSNNKGNGLPILSDGATAPSEKGDVSFIADTFSALGIGHLWGPLGVGDVGGVNDYTLPTLAEPLTARYSTPTAFFDAVLDEVSPEDLPLVEGVLGPIFTGCLTTWAHVKSLNRNAENTLQQTEFLMAVCRALDLHCDATALREPWRRLLLMHFHDALAGVCTEDIQARVELELRHIVDTVQRVQQRHARRIAESVATEGTGIPLVVFNPLGHRRSDIVEARLTLRLDDLGPVPADSDAATHHLMDASGHLANEQFEACDDNGHSVPVMVERFGRQQRRSVAQVRMLARDVPPFGYRTWTIRRRPRPEDCISIDGSTIKTDRLLVHFDPTRGGIDRFEDRKQGITIKSEHLPLGTLRLHDTGKYDLNYGQEGRQWEAGLTGRQHGLSPTDFQIQRCNGGRVAVRFDHRFGESTFRQVFLFDPSVPFVTLRVSGRFHEIERYCKAHFSVRGADHAAADLPYGFTPQLPEGVEYAMQYGAAVLGPGHALAVLNRGRPGCLWQDGTLSVSIIRCATLPSRVSDRGPFETELRLMALDTRGSNWQADLIRLGYEANLALCSYAPEHSDHRLERSWSMLDHSIDHVLGALVKPSETGQGVALRLYNSAAVPATQSITGPPAFPRMSESNILEEDLGLAGRSGERVELALRPYEVRTFLCDKRK